MRKIYAAVVCGKPVDNQGAYVDYLLKNQGNSGSEIVDNSVDGAKRAELTYRVLSTVKSGEMDGGKSGNGAVSAGYRVNDRPLPPDTGPDGRTWNAAVWG